MYNSSTIDEADVGLSGSLEPAGQCAASDSSTAESNGETQVCVDEQGGDGARDGDDDVSLVLPDPDEFPFSGPPDPFGRRHSELDPAEDDRWFDDSSRSHTRMCEIRWAHDARLAAFAPAMATVLVQASVAAGGTERPRFFRGLIRLFLPKLERVLLRLRAWTRRVNGLGARVMAVILLPPSCPLGRVAEVDLDPEHRWARTAVAAEIYHARLSTHCMWMSRHASSTPVVDRLDGLHDTVRTALERLQVGSIGLDEFAAAITYAYRDVLDNFRREGRNQRRAAARQHDIAREIGQAEEEPAGFAQPVDARAIELEAERERDVQEARLPDELSILGGAEPEWLRETAAYLGECLALSRRPSPSELAVYRKVDPATGSRSLAGTYRLLRRRLS